MFINKNFRHYGICFAFIFGTNSSIQANPQAKPEVRSSAAMVKNYLVVAQSTTTRDHRKSSSSTKSKAKPRNSNSTATVDHRRDKQRALNEVSDYLVWMIGANKTGVVNAVLTLRADPKSYYNLKGLQNRKFFQYERQGKGRGINLGWTKNASAQTAQEKTIKMDFCT